MEILNSIIIILAVGFGFYLGRFNDVNKKVAEAIQTVKEKTKKGYAEDFVVDTDEAVLEAQEIAKEERSEERIDIKSFIKDGANTKTTG